MQSTILSLVLYIPMSSNQSNLAYQFHHSLSWKGKALVALCLVTTMVLGSGCLTMYTVGKIEEKKAENKRKDKWRTDEEDKALKTFHDDFNNERFDQLCK